MPPTPACGICGAPARPAFRPPTAETAPDLDLRPGEPTRSTLARWVSVCRQCGACAPDLAALTPDQGAIVRSAAYCDLPATTARPFLRWAMLSDDGEAFMQAAWAADDADDAAAADFRRAAALRWANDADPRTALRRLDALRRCGDFGEARALLDLLSGDPEILAFQRARILARDAGRYLISSALRPPARTPHVGHGKRQTGFWKSLFG